MLKSLASKKPTIELRARIIQEIRAFFIGRGFLEVETPVLIPAPAPEANIDAPKAGGGYLHTSPELAMKRLLAAGYGDIFQICRVFRANERGGKHLPEFTLLEWYRRDADYRALMEDCKALFQHLAVSSCNGGRPGYRGFTTDLAAPWEEITVRDAYERFAGVSAERAIAEGDFDLLMVDRVEPRLGLAAPTILKEYPAEMAALSRLKPGDPGVAERFELYVAGLELANGFTELTDPAEQRARFEKERLARVAWGRDPYPMPEPFLRDLARLPPSAGIALGVDRLVMLFSGESEIDNVVTFTPEEL